MTAHVADRAPGRELGRPALSRCVAGDLDVFARDVWGQAPQLSRREDLPSGFEDLLNPAAVDELVSRRGLRAPFLRVAKAGRTLGDRAFTAPGGAGATISDQVDEDKLLDLFATGATLVLQGLHRTWPPLLDLAQSLAAELGHAVQVNAYVTPQQSQGFNDHYDVHDVFVLQVHGEKRWRIRPPVHPVPLRDQPWTDRQGAVEAAARQAPLLDVVLRPGDCLYLPRGFLHSATALGGTSIHLTVGVHTWTRFSLAQALVDVALAELAEDPAARQSLRAGVDVRSDGDVADELDAVRDRLVALLSAVPAREVSRRLATGADASQRPAPVGPLEQVELSASLDAGTPVVLRQHLAARLEPSEPHGQVLVTRAGKVPLDDHDLDALRIVLDGAPVTAGSLPLDTARGVDLLRRLARSGVVVPAPR